MPPEARLRSSTAIVVGAGPCGLAAARELAARGIAVRILDSALRAGEAWYHRHPQLRLNTHRHLSALPGLRIPRAAGAFPSRISIIRYLREYAARLDLPIDYGVCVAGIARADDGWVLDTSAGEYRAQHVVIATGHDRVPYTPDWPGRADFRGRLVHAADFGDLSQYRGRKILVAGAGNSGSDLLNHLVKIPLGELRVSIRHGPVVFPRRLWGIPIQLLSPVMAMLPVRVVDRLLALTERLAFGRLEDWGWRRHPTGGATRLLESGTAPAIDDGFVAALKAGRIQVVPAIERFAPDGVYLADGSRLNPDIVIAATGYRTGLEPLLGHLGVLDARGLPRAHGAQQMPQNPGLWFTGMQPRLTGFFYMAGRSARRIAAAIDRQLQHRDHARPMARIEATGDNPGAAS